LHVGDQFLSAGSNDFKARVVGTTAWIANPTETVELLDELKGMIELQLGNKKQIDEGEMKDELLTRVDNLFKKHPMNA
jgi:IMP and pyridine-specific 5'-nucleotidase